MEDQGKASDLKGGIFGRRPARIPGETMVMSSKGGKIYYGFKLGDTYLDINSLPLISTKNKRQLVMGLQSRSQQLALSKNQRKLMMGLE